MHSVKNLAMILAGISCTAPIASATHRSNSSEMEEALAALAGVYQLVETKDGFCAETVFFGMGRDAQSVRIGAHNFNALNMGRQNIFTSQWDGWSEASLGRDSIKSKRKLDSRTHDKKVKEKTSAEVKHNGQIEFEHEREVKDCGRSTRIRSKCLYVKMIDSGDEGDKGDQDQGDKGDQDDGK